MLGPENEGMRQSRRYRVLTRQNPVWHCDE
jgi:hypothetical protein